MKDHNQQNTQQPQQQATEAPRVERAGLNQAYAGEQGQQQAPRYAPTSPFAKLGIATRGNATDSEALEELIRSLTARANGPEEREVIGITVVPVTSSSLLLPIIAMAARTAGGEWAVYPILIESMLQQKLEPKHNVQTGPYGTIDTIIDMPTVRCFDSTAKAAVTAAVSRAVNCDPKAIAMLNAFVVPETMDITKTDKQADIFYNALMALVDMAGGNLHRVAHADLVNPAVEVQLKTNLTPQECRRNRVGRVVAADFHSTVTLVDITQSRRPVTEVHAAATQYRLAEATGYVDFTIMESAGQTFNPMAMQMGQQVQPQPGFIPTIVLTDISASGTGANASEDLGTQLMALASTLPISYNFGWTRLWEDQPGHPSPKTSLGYLGVEHDPLGRGPDAMGVVKVQSGAAPTEGVETPLTMAMKWCTQACALALDIEHGSRLDWIQSIFLDAAEQVEGANAEIVREANSLAPGFADLWAEANGGDRNASVMEPRVVNVHLGYFEGTDGRLHDIRELDYLSLVAQFEKDRNMIPKATAANVPGACTDLTLTDRRKVLTEISGCTIDGMATRVFFKPNFVACFIRALERSNVNLRSNDLMFFGHNGQRAGMSAGYAGVMAPGNLVTPTYSQGGGYDGLTGFNHGGMWRR